VGQIAACHAAELEDALGVVGLAEGDPAGVLAYFDAEVQAEEVEVALSNAFIICALNTSTFCSSAPVMMRSSTSQTLRPLPYRYTAASCALCLKPIFLSVASSFAF